jgi:hypothetical protein
VPFGGQHRGGKRAATVVGPPDVQVVSVGADVPAAGGVEGDGGVAAVGRVLQAAEAPPARTGVEGGVGGDLRAAPSWAMQAPSRLRGSWGLTARHGSAWATNSSWLTRTLAGRPGSGACSDAVVPGSGTCSGAAVGRSLPIQALATRPAPAQAVSLSAARRDRSGDINNARSVDGL